jgi:hypothetical protein
VNPRRTVATMGATRATERINDISTSFESAWSVTSAWGLSAGDAERAR